MQEAGQTKRTCNNLVFGIVSENERILFIKLFIRCTYILFESMHSYHANIHSLGTIINKNSIFRFIESLMYQFVIQTRYISYLTNLKKSKIFWIVTRGCNRFYRCMHLN